MGEKQDIITEAADRMQRIGRKLEQDGYTEQEREEFLVRLLLYFFTGNEKFFPDGTSGRAPEEREDGGLEELLASCRGIRWETVSPDLFGVCAEEIMDPADRRRRGACYTSAETILRVIRPLFLDELWKERESCRGNRRRLQAFHRKLSGLTFLDPACGCGNFLVLIYRRLRELEFDVVEELYDPCQRVLDPSLYCRVSVRQFYGIEIESSQAYLARISLWLTEQEMNRRAAERFGITGSAPPAQTPEGIVIGNALAMDWGEVVPPENLSYILGNPPFAGARRMNAEQKREMRQVFGKGLPVGDLDYVTAWYRKAAEFVSGTRIRCAFVSTNSICQGEQAGLLWGELKDRFHMSIDFAWKSFVWSSPVRRQAKIHCVIVGFSDASRPGRRAECALFDEKGRHPVPHINAYLTPGPDVRVTARRTPLAAVPAMTFGSMANDGGSLLVRPAEREEMLAAHPELAEFLRPFLGAREFIRGEERYCLWLTEADEEIRQLPEVAERIRQVRAYRLASPRKSTRKLAGVPERFGEIRQPASGSYILVPRVSSMRRSYIPMGFEPAEKIAGDALLIIPGGDESLFALLSSRLHMTWVRAVAGRLKSDYRYSASVVYNNFPFPGLSEREREDLSRSGHRILAVRASLAGIPPADLYDPEKMPEELKKVHRDNDILVEEICHVSGENEEERLCRLFRLFRLFRAGTGREENPALR